MSGKKCSECEKQLINVYIRAGLAGYFELRCTNCKLVYNNKGSIIRSYIDDKY